MRKFKGTLLVQSIQVADIAISLIKPSKGALKLEIFNLLNSFDHLFTPFSFYMIVHRWMKPVHKNMQKRKLKAYHSRVKIEIIGRPNLCPSQEISLPMLMIVFTLECAMPWKLINILVLLNPNFYPFFVCISLILGVTHSS